VRDVQWSQVNEKMWLKSRKKARTSTRDFTSEVKPPHYCTVTKDHCRTLRWRWQNLSDWTSNIS
jgi:hypothetical protein